MPASLFRIYKGYGDYVCQRVFNAVACKALYVCSYMENRDSVKTINMLTDT